MSIQVLCILFNWIVCYLFSWVARLLSIFWIPDTLQIFSFMCYIFTFLIVSFEAHKFFLFWCIPIYRFIFLYLLVLLGFYQRTHYLIQGHEDLLLCFILWVLALAFRSLIHLELIFIYDVRWGATCFACRYQVDTICWKTIFYPLNCLRILVENQFDLKCMCLFIDSQFKSIDLYVYPLPVSHSSLFLFSLKQSLYFKHKIEYTSNS